MYRSRLGLDSDLAARSASVGCIYRDLGFEQIALVDACKSITAHPADYSGHRFLSDSYSSLQRHDIARVSELLQSQLLQPINLTPIQPHLAESDLRIAEGAGPSLPAFNEFNRMYDYEMNAEIAYVLREDDQEAVEDDDNILTHRDESLKGMAETRILADGIDHRESGRTDMAQLDGEHHCWLFHDLLRSQLRIL